MTAQSSEHRAQSKMFFALCPTPFALSLITAQMAKLVDALVSGTSVSNDVQVRVLFWAQYRRPGGEIGRHASLRGWCSQGCASSSLVLGTFKSEKDRWQSKDCIFLKCDSVRPDGGIGRRASFRD